MLPKKYKKYKKLEQDIEILFKENLLTKKEHNKIIDRLNNKLLTDNREHIKNGK